jgi:peptidoglycan/xylan/chitin deacetylase (PgdA/CDA1 family)
MDRAIERNRNRRGRRASPRISTNLWKMSASIREMRHWLDTQSFITRLCHGTQAARLRWIILTTVCAWAMGGCTSAPPPPLVGPLPPVRFLLTFDDGPSAETEDNPTEKIADTLAVNPIQPGIKAVFFVQTRWEGAGGSAVGQRLLRRLAAEDHVLGLHSGTALGHIDHPDLSPAELIKSLSDGIGDIRAISGRMPDLLRPPDWEYNEATLSAYRRAGLGMLLTDVSARDGGAMIVQASSRQGGKIRRDLARFHQRLGSGAIPTVGGVAPVVMTFHDPNRYTAERLIAYLTTLTQDARRVGLKLASPPFYTERAALAQAARARAEAGIFQE